MTMALANMQIVISRLLRSLRITKGPTRWLKGDPHRQRENLLDRPDGHKRACTSQALHACSRQASAEQFQQCAECLPPQSRPWSARRDGIAHSACQAGYARPVLATDVCIASQFLNAVSTARKYPDSL